MGNALLAEEMASAFLLTWKSLAVLYAWRIVCKQNKGRRSSWRGTQMLADMGLGGV